MWSEVGSTHESIDESVNERPDLNRCPKVGDHCDGSALAVAAGDLHRRGEAHGGEGHVARLTPMQRHLQLIERDAREGRPVV